MQIDTKAMGRLDIDERQIIHFPEGLYGFESYRDFALLDSEQPPFYWLQSLSAVEVAFVLMRPEVIRPDYSLDAHEADLQALGDPSEDELLTFGIVRIPEEQSRMTVNLQGPVVINKNTREGRQIVSTNPEWGVRHYILEELGRRRDEAC